MIPDPLHPAVVHFPIVLVFLLPVVAVAALLAIRRGASARPVWAVPVAFAAALTLSAWVAVETGEADEDRVEAVVTEAALERHEEGAERFLVLSGVLFLVVATGLVGGNLGRAARAVAIAGSAGLVIAGFQVGHSGGELVYRHGAADAHVGAARGAEAAIPRTARRQRDDD
jgi:uncharacterized membrane protein